MGATVVPNGRRYSMGDKRRYSAGSREELERYTYIDFSVLDSYNHASRASLFFYVDYCVFFDFLYFFSSYRLLGTFFRLPQRTVHPKI